MRQPNDKMVACRAGDVIFRRCRNGWTVITIDNIEANKAEDDYADESASVYEMDERLGEQANEVALRQAIAAHFEIAVECGPERVPNQDAIQLGDIRISGATLRDIVGTPPGQYHYHTEDRGGYRWIEKDQPDAT